MKNLNTIHASDLLEILNQYTEDELKHMRIFVNNETFDDITLDKHDSFKVENIEVDDKLKIVYLEI